MNEHSWNDKVYIRSMGNHGKLGGLSKKAQEVGDVLAASGKDIIIFETVGVGQAEHDIISAADLSIVVLVPESGDEVQLNKYKTTPSTMLEIWKQGNLIVKTSLVAFEESTYSTADTQARVSGLNVTTHADELFDSDSNYGIVISNLQLKEEV